MKIGVVGNGMIVKRLLEDMREVSEIFIPAICVREQSREKGKALAETYEIACVYTDYEEFLNDPSFDTVYIGIINTEHFRYVKRALLAGKHVICEKPFTVEAWEMHTLAELARDRHLFLWEAFKIPYSPVFQAVKSHLKDIGTLKLVQCNYSRVSSRFAQYLKGEILPAFDPKAAGGCLYDINMYNLHFVTCLFGRPNSVRYYANKGYNGIDTSGTVILEYDNFHAVCTGAKDSSSPCFGVLQGSDGCIRIEGPVSSSPYAELITETATSRLAEDSLSGQLTLEILEFARQLRDRDYESCYRMLAHSVMMMEVLEAARKDAGISFDC